MSEQNGVDDRELDPDSTRYDGYAPGDWTVREVKNSHHVVFEYGGEAGSRLCHVEADGMSPVVTLHDGTDVPFYRGAGDGFTTFEGALAFAGSVMRAFELGVQAIQDRDGGGETMTFEATDSEHALTVTIPEDRSILSFGDDDQNLVDVMNEMDREAHERGHHEGRPVDGCPLCASGSDADGESTTNREPDR